MVLSSFFGKKPSGGDRSGDGARDSTGGLSERSDITTSLEFTHVGGDVGRALAAAAGKIQVLEVAVEDVAAIEEAAVLYANANESGARAVLEESIQGSGKQSERLWRMLFDLYRLTGERQAFETQGVVYAQQFEKSPPAWDAEPQAATAPAAREGAPAVNLSGNLSGAAKAQFEQLVRIGAKTGKLRIDLSRLRGIDDTGSTLLNETLDKLRQSKVRLVMLGAEHALTLLEPRLKIGEPEGRPYWLLALAMMQQLGDQLRFEDMAVNFAVTFEESPPSWDPPEMVVSLTDTDGLQPIKAEAPVVPTRDSFVMDGVISGAQPEILRKLAVYGSERNAIEIDASNLKRLEFVSAGALFNQIAQLQSQGKLTVIRHPNEMVAALMRVMGIDQIAQIELKK